MADVANVKLYYIGPDVPNPGRAFVFAAGSVYPVPPFGGYITVSEAVANRLIRRNRIVGPNGPGTVDLFTRNAAIAARLKQGKYAEAEEAKQPSFTREQLEEMLAALSQEETAKPAGKSKNQKEEEAVK